MLSEEEIIKKANELLTRVMSGYGLAKVDKIHLVLQGLLDLYKAEKEKNKFINEVKAIGTDDVVNVVLTKSQYEYLLERATNGFNKEKEKNIAIEIYRKDMPKDTKLIVMRKEDFDRNFSNEYIAKDKIKEKMEKLEDIRIENLGTQYYGTVEQCENKIEVLEELLKE